MTPLDILVSPVSIMVISLAVGYLLYAWSATIAPAFTRSLNKTMPYIGGEVATAETFQPGYQFFYVALFFTVVHVAALIIAVAPLDAPLLATLGYLTIITISITVLRWEQ